MQKQQEKQEQKYERKAANTTWKNGCKILHKPK